MFKKEIVLLPFCLVIFACNTFPQSTEIIKKIIKENISVQTPVSSQPLSSVSPQTEKDDKNDVSVKPDSEPVVSEPDTDVTLKPVKNKEDEQDKSKPSSKPVETEIKSSSYDFRENQGEIKMTVPDDTPVEAVDINLDLRPFPVPLPIPFSDKIPELKDGQKIAFIAKDYVGYYYNLYVINTDRSDLTQIVKNGNVSSLQWSPDGTKIAYYSKSKMNIYIIDTAGNKVKVSNDNVMTEYFSWSPDSTKIAFVGSEQKYSYNYNLFIANADGSGIRRLTLHSTKFAEVEPAWSPDGSKLVFASNINEKTGELDYYEIFSIDTDGNNLLQLTNTSSVRNGFPRWSPDGTRITFDIYTKSNDLHEIATVKVDGSDYQVLTIGNKPEWSPDGTRILYEVPNKKICTINADGSNQKILDSDGQKPVWSPDGSKIAFLSYPTYPKKMEVFIMNADGSKRHQITNSVYFMKDVTLAGWVK